MILDLSELFISRVYAVIHVTTTSTETLKLESTSNIAQATRKTTRLQQKTPPGKVVEPSVPAAPRKLQQASAQIRREGLKPRRLIHDLSSPDSGIDADKENQPPAEAAAAAAAAPIQESGIRIKRERR
ncbi:uncharacterized protein LOC131667057 isoform X3 [Phymastichus coffea]|uniref:uncharacterized protein LOC131667057 isoform X3 n=1 Tax=Phymastichus coffea TaxID=108790 RepID=UPI00273BD6CF|nr:uncharacterized protein LOC131667057 isoform X3 [Phymastichus coffea]